MSQIFSRSNFQKKVLSRLNNSNKNILIRKYLCQKTENINPSNEIHEKNKINKIIRTVNTSVKKNKYVKKININDYDDKSPVQKNVNVNSNKKPILVKKKMLKSKKKLNLENKENQTINQKEKIVNKHTKKKSLKVLLSESKTSFNQNLTKIDKDDKTLNFNKNQGNKLFKIIKNIENTKSKKENNNQKQEIKDINNNKEKEINDIGTNKTVMVTNYKTNIIENGQTNEDEELEENKIINISQDDDIEYYLKYEAKNKSEKIIKTDNNNDKIIPLKNIRNGRLENSRLKQMHRKINSLDNFLNSKEIKLYNPIDKYNNNERENGRNFMNVINNFDIIDIISRKERFKKISKSNHNNFNLTKEISEETIIKKYPTLKKKFKLNGLNIIYNDSNETSREKEKEIKNEESYLKKNSHNIYSLYKNISLLKPKKKNININKAISGPDMPPKSFQNSWNKKYFIPLVSATLVRDQDIKKRKINFNKKIPTEIDKTKMKDILTYSNYKTNQKNHLNFGDNNKKKRELLFNFENNNIIIDNKINLSLQHKRTNSFINKRYFHITERNNSINKNLNDSDNYNTNHDIDLDIQEKKLKTICKEIKKYKFMKKVNNKNLCSFTLENKFNKILSDDDKIEKINIKLNNNIHQIDKKNKKLKAIHLKLGYLNIINIKNDNLINGNKLVIKRGELLNKLRKIKKDYTNYKCSD